MAPRRGGKTNRSSQRNNQPREDPNDEDCFLEGSDQEQSTSIEVMPPPSNFPQSQKKRKANPVVLKTRGALSGGQPKKKRDNPYVDDEASEGPLGGTPSASSEEEESEEHGEESEPWTPRAKDDLKQRRVGKRPMEDQGSVQREDDLDETRFASRESLTRYGELVQKIMKGEQGFFDVQKQNWMVRDAINELGWGTFLTHPNHPSSSELTCEFLANLSDANNRVYLRGQWYNLTPELIAEVLGLDVQPGDDNIARNWEVNEGSEANLRDIGRSLCGGMEPRWQGKKFSGTMNPTELLYPHRIWVRIWKSKVHPVPSTTIVARDLIGLSRIQRAARIPVAHLIHLHMQYIRKTPRTSPAFPDLIWKLAERFGMDMSTIPMDTGPENSIWQFPDVPEGTDYKLLRGMNTKFISKPRQARNLKVILVDPSIPTTKPPKMKGGTRRKLHAVTVNRIRMISPNNLVATPISRAVPVQRNEGQVSEQQVQRQLAPIRKELEGLKKKVQAHEAYIEKDKGRWDVILQATKANQEQIMRLGKNDETSLGLAAAAVFKSLGDNESADALMQVHRPQLQGLLIGATQRSIAEHPIQPSQSSPSSESNSSDESGEGAAEDPKGKGKAIEVDQKGKSKQVEKLSLAPRDEVEERMQARVAIELSRRSTRNAEGSSNITFTQTEIDAEMERLKEKERLRKEKKRLKKEKERKKREEKKAKRKLRKKEKEQAEKKAKERELVKAKQDASQDDPSADPEVERNEEAKDIEERQKVQRAAQLLDQSLKSGNLESIQQGENDDVDIEAYIDDYNEKQADVTGSEAEEALIKGLAEGVTEEVREPDSQEGNDNLDMSFLFNHQSQCPSIEEIMNPLEPGTVNSDLSNPQLPAEDVKDSDKQIVEDVEKTEAALEKEGHKEDALSLLAELSNDVLPEDNQIIVAGTMEDTHQAKEVIADESKACEEKEGESSKLEEDAIEIDQQTTEEVQDPPEGTTEEPLDQTKETAALSLEATEDACNKDADPIISPEDQATE